MQVLCGRALLRSIVIRCYITDSQSAGGVEPLLHWVAQAIADGVEWIQLREKTATVDLVRLTKRVMALAKPVGTKVIVNSRVDVALACGAHGVHLPSDSMPVQRVRQIAQEPFLIGVSTHSLEEALRAEQEGASYVFFSPVFTSVSKPGYGPEKGSLAGLRALQRVCKEVRIPVLALGGIDEGNAVKCMQAGAAGFAAISMFQQERE